ncbi:uncharacterized protein si:ch1073-126c3.2 [Anoplopoma fimbria]|uniref:uncharacterized protein si:ch1073-126c3.2 n=1 Tax=Anoplopoma fimbria TaxID=229290 RepID=UPI0023EC4BD4|nr:uncharacterized protein si:ch1073-126c3.2 [Anoplopoma fimbria]
MALQGIFTFFCSLAVLSSSAALLQNCSSQTQHLSAELEVAIECGENLTSGWSTQRTAALLLSLRDLTDTLHKHQLQECRGAEPNKCPEAKVPHHGGLACVTVAKKRYCKPLCSHGYDFAFIRRSRLYEECSKQTGFRWQTQYVGGNKLAVCNESPIQVSGASSAYFPENQDCLKTKSNSTLQSAIMGVFVTELRNQGIQDSPEFACLVCG